MNWMMTYFVTRIVIVGLVCLIMLKFVGSNEYSNLTVDFRHCRLFDAPTRKSSWRALAISVSISLVFIAESIVRAVFISVRYEAVAVMAVPLFIVLVALDMTLFGDVVEKAHEAARVRNDPKIKRLEQRRRQDQQLLWLNSHLVNVEFDYPDFARLANLKTGF